MDVDDDSDLEGLLSKEIGEDNPVLHADPWLQSLLGEQNSTNDIDIGNDGYSPESPIKTPDFLDAPEMFFPEENTSPPAAPASDIDSSVAADTVDHGDVEVELPKPAQPAPVPGKPLRGRAGRPKGTTKTFLAWQAAQAREDIAAEGIEIEKREPEPGSIAHAGQARKQKLEERRRQEQTQFEASNHGSIEAVVGDTSQRSLWGMCCHAWRLRSKDKSCSEKIGEVGEDNDPVVTALLDGAAVSASCKGVQRLMQQPYGVKDLLFQVGAAIFAFGTWMWAVFLSHLLTKCRGSSSDGSSQCWRAVLVICKLRYDETPSKVRVSVSEAGDHKILGKHDPDEACTHAKVLQAEHVQAVLLQNHGDKSFVFCTSKLPTHLSAVDRTTGENTRSVLWQQVAAVPEYLRISSAFEMKVRISVADRYPANIRAELGLQQSGYLDHFVNAFFPCDVHKLHSSIKNASENASFDVAGLLNAGLSCTDLGSTRTLRAILISILDQELEIIHSCPPVEPGGQFDEYRQGVFDLYLPQHAGIPRGKKKTHAKIRFILSYFLNGDLTSSTIIHYCPRGCCQSEASCRQNIAHFLAWALIPKKLPVLSRKTWTGFHDSLAWVGILASHHGLFQRVMEKFVGKPTPALAQAPNAPDGSWLDVMLALGPGPGHESNKAARDQKHSSAADQNPLQKEAKSEQHDDEPDADEPDWLKKKRQSKQTARDWVASQPAQRIAVLTDCVEPLFILMNKFLKMSGANWRRQQERLAFSSKKRTYAVVEAALGKDVAECKIQA